MMEHFFLLMKQELLVTAIIFILLISKLGVKDWNRKGLLLWVNVLLTINLLAGFFGDASGNLFGTMFFTNSLVSLEKSILNLGVLIISLQSYNWLLKQKHAQEFYILILSTLLGMYFMISSQNMLMFYLGLELASIPLASLANFDLELRRSSEAAMKYIMSSAFASGIMLFGISMMYGATGTLDYAGWQSSIQNETMFIFSFILILSGFAFKISAVPFHLWTADVYEGAPIPVTSYFSVISKGSMIFVMTSVFYTAFEKLQIDWYRIIIILSVLSMIVGNLFALRQQNLKRFLAFSSISQVGFILIGILGGKIIGVSSVIYFVLIYLFSNLATFGVITAVSEATGKENIRDYKGFYKTNRGLSWILAFGLFSLAGIPPTAGFFGKFFLILSGAGGTGNYILITIAALNMVISLFYYLRIVKAIFMDATDYPLPAIKVSIPPLIGMGLAVLGIIVTGVIGSIYEYINMLVKTMW
jgi:NADH-quinone oxidoreductase subunit N